MNDPTGHPLAEHVRPTIDEARLARQWSAISDRLDRPARRPMPWPVLFGIAVVVVVAAVFVGRAWRTPTVPVAAKNEPDSLSLPDGSRVVPSAGARVAIQMATSDRVAISVESGVAEFDVTHLDGRTFVVTAGRYEVVVVGTKFSVAVDDARERRVTVSVKEGRVRVDGGSGDSRLISAGESWSGSLEPAPVADVPPIELEDASPTTSLDAGSPRAIPSAPKESAKELLARATVARSEGRPREAAAALDTLRKQHRTDARAGVAAFELGRIRLDALGDPAGAAEAFGDAMALGPDAPFREDAQARQVEAFDRSGNRSRCLKAKAAYESRYAQGLHAKQVARRCE